jgi:anti-sigma regulatory factor (Ser/Thr protein kinase)
MAGAEVEALKEPKMGAAVDDFGLELPVGIEAGAAARRAVMEHASGLPDVLQADILLLVTELVTNAVRHGGAGPGTPLRLECRQAGNRLRFLVTDPGTALLSNGGPPVRPAGSTNGDASGWGLFFVEQIAERWGVLAAPPGTCVWFDVAVAA